MKRIIDILAIMMVVFISGCELEPTAQLTGDPVPPSIILPATGQAFNFNWDNNEDTVLIVITQVDFGFPIAVSYLAEIDRRGGDFERSKKLGFFSGDTLKVAVRKINSEVKKLKYEDSEVAELDFRVSGHVSNEIENINSNVLPISFVPFSEPEPEEPEEPENNSEKLYMIGAATGAWDPEKAVELIKGDDGLFTVLAYFSDAEGRNFRFFSNTDWSASLGGYDILENYPGDILEPAAEDDDPNFNLIGANGWYNVVVDLTNKTIEMTAAETPELYLTGDATHGWGWDELVSTIYGTANYIFEGDIAFVQNNAFRVFPHKDWSVSYGYDYFTNYNTEVINIMEGHDDPNWQFLLESGTYHVTIDMKNLSIDITE